MRSVPFVGCAVVGGACLILCASSDARSGSLNLGVPGILEPGTYQLGNHPANDRRPPDYGLQLDELIDVDPNRIDVFTFDFEATGADMRLDFDGTSVRIYGTAYGGRDTGPGYDPNYEGFVTIDMTYAIVQTDGVDDDLFSFTPNFTNHGTITLWDNSVHDLYDYGGDFGHTLRIGNGDDDTGINGWPGVSGIGWLSYDDSLDGLVRGGAQDWGFIVFGPFGSEGCTPGYWKNHRDSWIATGLLPEDELELVFDVPDQFGLDHDTLLRALNYGGGPGALGSARILLRAAVAAVLNALHPDIQYPFTFQQVVDDVNAALASGDRQAMLDLKDRLDADNNLGCPLN